MIATEEERKMINFGLGYDQSSQYDSKFEDDLKTGKLNKEQAEHKEGLATLLHGILIAKFGIIPAETVNFTGYFTGADHMSEKAERIKSEIQLLKKLNIIPQHYIIKN